jgi:hypothetical protein
MLNFSTSTAQDFADYGRSLWLKRDQYTSHEQASQYIVRHLFEEFITDDGYAQLALVRIFRLLNVNELAPDIRSLAGPKERQVMALTGTWGLEEAWQDRHSSEGHQVIPISAIALPQQIPMFQEVLRQLGIDIDHFYETQELVTLEDRPYQGTFHIPDATIPAIPAQDTFVRPYKIKSLVGFGGFITTHQSLYLLYAFSRVPVSVEAAENFFHLQEFVGATVAMRDQIFEV